VAAPVENVQVGKFVRWFTAVQHEIVMFLVSYCTLMITNGVKIAE
jgi:hypothetical protein